MPRVRRRRAIELTYREFDGAADRGSYVSFGVIMRRMQNSASASEPVATMTMSETVPPMDGPETRWVNVSNADVAYQVVVLDTTGW